MTTYVTHFGGYTVDVQPSDWTVRWDAANSTWAVKAKSGTEAGQVLQHTATASARRLLSWDAVDGDANRDNAEILVRFRSTSDSDYQGLLVLRGSGAAGTETGYYLTFDNPGITDTILLGKYNNGTSSAIGTNIAITFDPNTFYLIRFRVNGSSLKARWWADGTAEPSTWNLEQTDTSITGTGWVGVGNFTSTGTRDFDYVSIGTNGDTAPLDVSTTTPIRSTQLATETLHQAASPGLRSTQLATETLHQAASPALRSTQLVVESLVVNPYGRTTQSVIEALLSPTTVDARFSQDALETLLSVTPDSLISQLCLELLLPHTYAGLQAGTPGYQITNDADTKTGSQVTLSEGVYVDRMVFVSETANGSAKVRGLVYDSDGAGEPNALKGQTADKTGVVAGENQLDFAEPLYLAAGDYYLVIQSDQNVNIQAKAGQGKNRKATDPFADGPGNSFGPPTNLPDQGAIHVPTRPNLPPQAASSAVFGMVIAMLRDAYITNMTIPIME